MKPDKVYHVRINGTKLSKLGAGGYLTHEELSFHLPRIILKLNDGDELTIYCEPRDAGCSSKVRPETKYSRMKTH